MKYETVIGLEIHAQLATASKMFCFCSTTFGTKPNTNICPICTGQPGVLPVINKKTIELAIKTALALNCRIEHRCVFARKHYFYPDLPKNYQISQYELPLATQGHLEIKVDGKTKRIGILRVHLEEDAGKLVHKGAGRIMGAEESLVDYNRTGVPLMEIVSAPELRTPREAAVYTQILANLLRHLEVCDAKMEEGSLRCDANISVREFGAREFGVKTEVKNMNSFKAIEKALLAEEKRHIRILDNGEKVIQETRFFDDVTETTSGMRSKEFTHDYRYFPEPDLVPIEPPPTWIEEIRKTIGELPQQKEARFIQQYHLSPEIISILVADKAMARFFEETVLICPKPSGIANWLVGEISAYLNENKINFSRLQLTPAQLAEILNLIDNGILSGNLAKTVLIKVLTSGKQVRDVITEAGLTQISDENELEKIAREVIGSYPKPVEEYKTGKEAPITFLIGQIMKLSKGRANPSLAHQVLRKLLSKL